MTDNDGRLGPAITKAVRFLRKIHRDIGDLIAALDGVTAERDWQPTEASRVTWALSNSSDSSKWLLDYLFRFYCKGTTPAALQDLLAFVIWLDPPSSFDEPLVLGAVARFADPTSYPAIVQQWDDTGKVFEALRARPGPRPLSADEVVTFLPAASHVFGTSAPLCSLTGTESLLALFLEPLLAAQPTLGR